MLNLCLWIFGKFKVAFVYRFRCVVARFHLSRWRVSLHATRVAVYIRIVLMIVMTTMKIMEMKTLLHSKHGQSTSWLASFRCWGCCCCCWFFPVHSCWFLVAIRCARASPTPSNNEWMLQKHIIHLRRLYTSPIAKGLKIHASVSLETWTAQVSHHIFTVFDENNKNDKQMNKNEICR